MNNLIKTMFPNPRDAKNFFSLIVGYKVNTKEYQQFLIAVYDSIDKTEFDYKDYKDSWFNIFDYYYINELNKSYYEIYKPYFVDSQIAYLETTRTKVELNCEITYKNIMEFTKTVDTLGLDFLMDSHEIIHKLLKKSKPKVLIDNFHRYYVWHKMVDKDYQYFINFCDEFKLNRLDIIKNCSYHRYGSFFIMESLLKEENLTLYINDIRALGKDTIDMRSWMNQTINPLHIVLVHMRFKEIAIHLFYKFFKEEILQIISRKSSGFDDTSLLFWRQVFENNSIPYKQEDIINFIELIRDNND